jgi:hypothetical protein
MPLWVTTSLSPEAKPIECYCYEDRAKGGYKLSIVFNNRRLQLGSYNIEAEARYAARHLHFLFTADDADSVVIPDKQCLSPQCRVEIEQNVEYLLEIRGMFGPRSRSTGQVQLTFRRSPSSQYRGVSPHQSGRWRTTVKINGRYRSLGYYPTRHEAAQAFNYAAQLLYDDSLFPNIIPPNDLPDQARQAQIRTKVEAMLRKYGVILTPLPDATDRQC